MHTHGRNLKGGRSASKSRPASLSTFPPREVDPRRTALFLDFDGTLAEIADRPEAVKVRPPVRAALASLHRATGGALSIISGRPISQIDGFVAPLNLAVAGVHGLERRDGRGNISTAAIDEPLLARLREKIARLADAEPGLLLEVKTGSIALHYRRRPELEDLCSRTVDDAVADLPGLEVLRGKKVIEIKAGRSTKGDAIAAFMQEEPFVGRTPLFAGDDVTDEDAFREIARLGGISIKIGNGDTLAAYRARSIAQFHEWLIGIATATDDERRTG